MRTGLAVAEACLLFGLPRFPSGDPGLDEAFAVFSRREGEEPEVVGWVVRWSREVDGLPVRGNGVADHIAVLVGPAGVAATSWWWPTIDTAPASPPPADAMLDSSAALRSASDGLARVVKGELRLVSARPVWGTTGPGSSELVPAWEYAGTSGSAVVVDALSGRVLR